MVYLNAKKKIRYLIMLFWLLDLRKVLDGSLKTRGGRHGVEVDIFGYSQAIPAKSAN
jgi:hypothetical protein